MAEARRRRAVWLQRPTPVADPENWRVWGEAPAEVVPHSNEPGEFERFVPEAALKAEQDIARRERKRVHKAEAALAKARKEGREEVQNVLGREIEKARLHHVKGALVVHVGDLNAALDSLTKEGTDGG